MVSIRPIGPRSFSTPVPAGSTSSSAIPTSSAHPTPPFYHRSDDSAPRPAPPRCPCASLPLHRRTNAPASSRRRRSAADRNSRVPRTCRFQRRHHASHRTGTPRRVPSSASHQCARLPAHPSRRPDGHGPERGAAVSATRLTKTEGATVTSSNVHAAAAAPPRTTAGSGVPSRAAVVAIGAHPGAQLVAQVTSRKSGVMWDRAVDIGLFVYPITFTLRDVVHQVAGRSAARTLIVTCAGLTLFLPAYLGWTASVE